MAQDPYKYFRIEARELLEGLSQGILGLEKGSGGKERVGQLLRLAHTLKGAARVVKQSEVGDLAHAIEDSLAPLREGSAEIPRARIDEMLRLLDAISARLAAIDPAAKSQRGAPLAGEDLLETVRVELGEMDGLLEDVADAAAHLAALDPELERLARARRTAARLADEARRARIAGGLGEELEGLLSACQRSLDSCVDRAAKGIAQVRERANRLRLLPASTIFASLERAVRDAAQSLGKRVGFLSSGGENRIDAHVLAALRDALLHVTRNCVAHGIEPERERADAGKEPEGRVTVAVERQGNRVSFLCRDDGRGIDVEAVRRAALQKGVITPQQAGMLGTDEAVRLLLQGGVTTTGSVTDVSGRGIGLDVVRETVRKLKGEIQVLTEKGRGTTLKITVPVSLTSLPAVLVEAGRIRAVLPLDSVPVTRRVADREIGRSSEGDSVLHEGKGIPLVPLSRLLIREERPGIEREFRSVVIVRSGAEHAALEVDRVCGTSNVVVRSLPSWLGADPVVAGAAMDAQGSPQLVLDPGGLVQAARAPRPRAPQSVRRPPPVLVVDDSLTTRMLEQSILESAGYEVGVAVSGEEALSKARARRFGLFLVDVEMPGMDGFEFIARTRSDPALRDTPAILVTSRGSAEDRKRGEEVGASAYVVKSEFDQGRLLRLIERLMG